MAQSETLTALPRPALGSRPARKLRAQGRVPANIQGDAEHPHRDISLDEREFLATRRHHTHLYDIDIEGETETAVVRDLQWDAFGDRIAHIEFRRVQRGVRSQFEVPLEISGHPKSGLATLLMSHIPVLTLPSMIPDAIEVKVDDLAEGTHIHARDLVLPEGVELPLPPETEVAMITHTRIVVEVEEAAAGAAEPTEPEIIGEKKGEPEEGAAEDEGKGKGKGKG